MRADDTNKPRSPRDSLAFSRRQLLGTAATGLAAASLPSALAFADSADTKVDVLLIGGGIMSATLGVLAQRAGADLVDRDGRAPG